MSSQGREDAILAGLFATIGTTNRVAVEVGARDGVKGSNTWQFRQQGWTCVLLDAAPKAPEVHYAWLTAESIGPTFVAHLVPPVFDLLSIDVDGMDFHLWKALTGFRPRVVVIEYNSVFPPEQSLVLPYDPAHHWDKTIAYGASAAALVKLGREKGYRLVAYTPRQNLIFVRHDAADEAVMATLDEQPIPPAEPCGYPPGRARRWEAY